MSPNEPSDRPLPFLAVATLCLFVGLIAAAGRVAAPAPAIETLAPQPPAAGSAP